MVLLNSEWTNTRKLVIENINCLAANVPLLEHVLEPYSLFIKSSSDDGFGSNDTFRYALFADVPKLD